MAKISNIKKPIILLTMERYKKIPKKGTKHREQTGRKPAQAGNLRKRIKQTSESAMNRGFLQKNRLCPVIQRQAFTSQEK